MIDNKTLTNFRQDFKKAMEALEKQYGFIIDLGNINYSATSFTGKLEVREGDSRDDLNEQEFKMYCKMYGLDYDDYEGDLILMAEELGLETIENEDGYTVIKTEKDRKRVEEVYNYYLENR